MYEISALNNWDDMYIWFDMNMWTDRYKPPIDSDLNSPSIMIKQGDSRPLKLNDDSRYYNCDLKLSL